MSLPPTTVKIKRKRNAEAPPEYLRVHEISSKRQRTAPEFAYERQAEPDKNATAAQPNFLGARPIKPLKTLSRAQSSQSLRANTQQTLPPTNLPKNQNATDGGRPKEVEVGQYTHTNSTEIAPTSANTGDLQNQPAPVRRFHISRTPASQESPGQARKRKNDTIFVERKVRPRTPQDPNQHQAAPPPTSQPTAPSQPQKRPGRNARTPVPRTPDVTPSKPTTLPERSAAVPSALRNRWDVKSEDLVAQMQEYTLQEIGYNLTESDSTRAYSGESSTPIINRFASSKFKPTAPKLRYSQRHPEEAKASADHNMEVKYDSDVEMGSDEEYVVDTYIRVPVDALQLTASNIGLLVLDSEVDIEEFYRGDEESDEEDDLEDEDENAENHYSADYPDEEVDSDDEYGRNAYNYRLNASDDEFDATYSDSENEQTKYPWKTKEKAWMAQTHDDFD